MTEIAKAYFLNHSTPPAGLDKKRRPARRIWLDGVENR
jgi:hypothetical protein